MPDTLDVLIKARDLISKPEHWCVNVFNITTSQGIAYCSRGAIFNTLGFGLYDYNAFSIDDETYCQELLKGVPKQFPHRHHASETIAQYNNTHNHEEIMAMFNKTIAELKSEMAAEPEVMLLAA
jgi:hypothetical protein